MSEVLKPCPFCGGETIRTYTATCSQNQQLYRIGDRLFPIARCGGCYAEVCGEDGDRGVGTAIAAWNRRAPDRQRDEACAEVEKLRGSASELMPCPDCGGTGLRDSGGTHPWGEPIYVPCDCGSDLPHQRDEARARVDALSAVLWMAEEWFRHSGSDATIADDYRAALDRARAALNTTD